MTFFSIKVKKKTGNIMIGLGNLEWTMEAREFENKWPHQSSETMSFRKANRKSNNSGRKLW